MGYGELVGACNKCTINTVRNLISCDRYQCWRRN